MSGPAAGPSGFQSRPVLRGQPPRFQHRTFVGPDTDRHLPVAGPAPAAEADSPRHLQAFLRNSY